MHPGLGRHYPVARGPSAPCRIVLRRSRAFAAGLMGAPKLGFVLTGSGTWDCRIGWRLASVIKGDPGSEVDRNATRGEPSNGCTG